MFQASPAIFEEAEEFNEGDGDETTTEDEPASPTPAPTDAPTSATTDAPTKPTDASTKPTDAPGAASSVSPATAFIFVSLCALQRVL